MESSKHSNTNFQKNNDDENDYSEKELKKLEEEIKDMDLSETLKLLSEKYYQGDIINGKKEGKGLLIDLNGDIFEGIFINDKKEGFGVYLFESGKKYVGQFRNDILDGVGSYFFINGSEYYGEIFETEMHGFGNYHYPSGSYYVGEFKNGEMDGIGTLYFSGNERYEGEFKNDNMNGIGKYFYADGDYFEGEFSNDVKNGFGITYYSNGERIEGLWENDKKNGICSFYFTNGDYVINNYKDNLIEGNGFFIEDQTEIKLEYFAEDNKIKKFLNLDNYFSEKIEKSKASCSVNSIMNLDIKNLEKLFEFFESDPNEIFFEQLINLKNYNPNFNTDLIKISCIYQECQDFLTIIDSSIHIRSCKNN